MLDAARDEHLLELARDRIFVTDQDVLGHLLRDRRAAPGALARVELDRVINHRLAQADVIDPAMRPEVLVLRRQKGIDQGLGKIDEAQLHPPLARIAVNDAPVRAAYHRRQRRLIVDEPIRRGQVTRDQHPRQQPQRQYRRQSIARPPHPAIGAPAGRQCRRRGMHAQAIPCRVDPQPRQQPARVAADAIGQSGFARRQGHGARGLEHFRSRWNALVALTCALAAKLPPVRPELPPPPPESPREQNRRESLVPAHRRKPRARQATRGARRRRDY